MIRNKIHASLAQARYPVLAGYSDIKPAATTLALMQCAACDTNLVTNYQYATACPCCAETMQPHKNILKRNKKGKVLKDDSGDVLARTIEITAAELKEMKKIGRCSHCSTAFRANDEVLAALANRTIFCTTCGNDVQMALSDIENDTDDGTDLDTVTDTEDMDDDYTADDAPDDVSDDGATVDEAVDDSDLDDTEDADNSVADLTGGDAAEVESDEDLNSSLRLNEASVEEDTETLEDVPAEEYEATNFVRANTLAVNMLDQIRDQDIKTVKPELVLTGGANPHYYLFANQQPVAKVNPEAVVATLQGKVYTSTFNKLFLAAASNGIDNEVIRDFGLEPLFAQLSVEEATAKTVKQQIRAKLEEIKQTKTEIKATFDQCVGVAAVGINKGVFEADNVLRNNLVETLAHNNVRDADILVDNAFAQHGQAYLREIIGKALEIREKPPAAIAELVEVVDKAPQRVNIRQQSSRSQKIVAELAAGSLPVVATVTEADVEEATPTTFKNIFQLGRKRNF